MTRKDIEQAYDIDENGIITSPGKFEAEPVYVPYFWEFIKEGEELGDDGLQLEISNEDIAEFPELTGYKYIILWESDAGFVFSDLER